MANADSAGARVAATLSVATGPKSQVTGASTTPKASELALDSRLIPTGWNIAEE